MIVVDRDIWEFDVDDTLIMWDRSKYPKGERVFVETEKGTAELIINRKNVNMLIKGAKLGYYIRVHSGSGAKWALKIVRALKIDRYVDSVETKPKAKTDDKAPGDGITYLAYRDPETGTE
jgi:hypothetical protein